MGVGEGFLEAKELLSTEARPGHAPLRRRWLERGSWKAPANLPSF